MVTPIVLRGPSLALATCARRLAPLGVRPRGDEATGSEVWTLEWDGPGVGGPLEVDLSWYGAAALGGRPGSEAAVQALTGLMQVHGRDAGAPRRIGLEVASVAAGVLAAQAVTAAIVGRSRGVSVTGVESSVLQAGLLLVSHRVAADSSGDEWVPAPPGPAPGPPFRSADGAFFEIETLDPDAWKAFWEHLGAGRADLGWAWRLFRPRYFRGTCTLPSGLHEATASRSLAEIAEIATACGVSLSPVRDYDEVVADLDPSECHPLVRPLSGQVPARPGAGMPPRHDALPLTGVRVVEATSRMQGPLASLLLELLGAHVVRVEPPGGDLFRTVPPLLGDTGSFYLTFNRGKETVELDLRNGEGRDGLLDLAAGADVFLQNWRPGKAAEWELDGDDLADVNPRIVYAYASGWGSRTEMSHLVGTDFLVQAYAGIGAGINPAGHPPLPSRALLTDYAGALVTCEAILAGLCASELSGRGQRVDAALLNGAMTLQAHVLEAIIAGQETGRRRGRPLWGPLDHPLRTADGWLVASIASDEDRARMFKACDVDPAEGGGGDADARLLARIAGDTSASWEAALTDAGLACAQVCTDLGALPRDPRVAELFEPLPAAAGVPRSPRSFAS